jgi:hypothetical protein
MSIIQSISGTPVGICRGGVKSGLPDGLFSNQKIPTDIFYGHLVYFTAIWDVL